MPPRIGLMDIPRKRDMERWWIRRGAIARPSIWIRAKGHRYRSNCRKYEGRCGGDAYSESGRYQLCGYCGVTIGSVAREQGA